MVKLTVQEETFLNMIKPTIMSESIKYKICPSIIAALAIIESNWGTNRIFSFSRNIFHLKIDSNWFGKCYNDKNQLIYEKASDCDIIGAILYKVYNNHLESIEDFYLYLLESRRSKNGPLKYQSIINCLDYNETLNRLVRAGFMQHYLNRNDDISYTQRLLAILEKYELYLWDMSLKESIKLEEEMSKKHRNRIATVPQIAVKPIVVDEDNTTIGAEETINNELEQPTLESFQHIYRVRLDWEKPDTQIFSSPIYEDAKAEAEKHEGYKIYIDDDGVLFEDPWIKVEEKVEPPQNSNIIRHIQPIPGKVIYLEDTGVYKTAIAKFPFSYFSGKFVFYDYTVSNGRAKIITENNFKNNRTVEKILGWINIR